ncbi:MAG TPA: heme exporter protein CcmD [Steroidobacteraceae bacterium]|nr:heme exporter protein CcmD [Steroidobacteraceae bacterium]
MNLGGFFAMGGYAAFVWPSYGLVLFALVWNAVAARRLHAAARRDAARRAGAGERA